MMPTLPARKTTFESTLSRLSAETRCTSAMSLLMRDTTSPSLVCAQKRGDNVCRWRYSASRMSKSTEAETRTYS
jgi:hypothetical protein